MNKPASVEIQTQFSKYLHAGTPPPPKALFNTGGKALRPAQHGHRQESSERSLPWAPKSWWTRHQRGVSDNTGL